MGPLEIRHCQKCGVTTIDTLRVSLPACECRPATAECPDAPAFTERQINAAAWGGLLCGLTVGVVLGFIVAAFVLD